MQYFQRYLATWQALLYTKQNLTVVTITTPNGFRIRPYITEIRRVSKLPLAMNNPVVPIPRNQNPPSSTIDAARCSLSFLHLTFPIQAM